jgi:hypothetical protein
MKKLIVLILLLLLSENSGFRFSIHSSLRFLKKEKLRSPRRSVGEVATTKSTSFQMKPARENEIVKESNPPQASFFVSSINLIKNCVGSAMFSVPFRVNSVSTDPSSFPSIVLLVSGLALWAAHNFYILGETCRLTGSKTYAEAWSKSISPKTQWIPQLALTTAQIVGCLANMIVLTDVLKLVLKVLGVSSIFYDNRVFVVSLLTSVILFPICNVKALSGLKSVSFIGIVGQVIATICLLMRLLDGSYRVGGQYFQSANIGELAKNYLEKGVAASPASAVGLASVGSQWFILASLLSYCFVAHYNVSVLVTRISLLNCQFF